MIYLPLDNMKTAYPALLATISLHFFLLTFTDPEPA
jgi:hypothetical protein